MNTFTLDAVSFGPAVACCGLCSIPMDLYVQRLARSSWTVFSVVRFGHPQVDLTRVGSVEYHAVSSHSSLYAIRLLMIPDSVDGLEAVYILVMLLYFLAALVDDHDDFVRIALQKTENFMARCMYGGQSKA